jgi:hypothetical protein
MVIDILSPTNRNKIELRLVNVYHDKPSSGHALTHLFSHSLDPDIPTLFLGDFNTHSPRWSFPHSTTSSWAHSFHDWMDNNGLETLNPTNTHTWTQPGRRSSIIDLALANESARYFSNLSGLTVSWTHSVSDHAALLINFQIETPHPTSTHQLQGYHIDASKQEEWSRTFRDRIFTSSILTSSDPAEIATLFHDIILASCEQHLDKIKQGPPKGAVWWNENCSAKLHLLRSSPVGEERRTASKAFRSSVLEAKRSWAHQQLFENVDTTNIWRMASVRKGRRSQVLPPLRDADGEIHSDTHEKASLLKNRFFPEKSNAVDIDRASLQDPDPLPTRPWVPITPEEISEALKDTSNKSAPGPSGINYKIIKWANAACPEVLTHIFNLSLSTGTHVMETRDDSPRRKTQQTRLQRAQSIQTGKPLECTGKLLEKVITRAHH